MSQIGISPVRPSRAMELLLLLLLLGSGRVGRLFIEKEVVIDGMEERKNM
jgi:hypothetical protein